MKVCLVNKFLWRKGGSETYCLGLADALRAAGHEVVFFAMRHPRNPPCAQEGYFVEERDYNGRAAPARRARDAAELLYSRAARDSFGRLLRGARACAGPAAYRAMQGRGRALVLEGRDLPRHVARLLGVYAELAEGKRGEAL